MHKRGFRPNHLGLTVQQEYLDDYQLTAEQFAAAVHLPLVQVLRLVDGHDPVDADWALRLSQLFGGTPQAWLSWQQLGNLWDAEESLRAELESITPLDPETRLSWLEREPLPPEIVAQIKNDIAEHRDPRRWVVVSRIGDEDVPLHVECITRMFYNVESNSYCTDLSGATPFKCPRVAEHVAESLGDHSAVLEVTSSDLDRPARNRQADRELRERFFRNTGQGMSAWDIGAYLRDREHIVAYLKAAAEDGDPDLVAVAVDDVFKAMAAQTTVEYLRERGLLGDRDAYDAVLARAGDSSPDERRSS